MKILSKYITRQAVITLFFTMGVFTFVLLLARIRQQAQHDLAQVPSFTCLETIERFSRVGAAAEWRGWGMPAGRWQLRQRIVVDQADAAEAHGQRQQGRALDSRQLPEGYRIRAAHVLGHRERLRREDFADRRTQRLAVLLAGLVRCAGGQQ